MAKSVVSAFLPACLLAVSLLAQQAPVAPPPRPVAGPVPIMKSSELKPGMTGFAWTVFSGSEPEPIPVEIIGLMKNAWGPRQDVILAKMGGRAQQTNVAGGMSGSPVYIDGKLIGAVALRVSVFSPDAICGITPIELMLEIEEFDASRPAAPKAPGQMPSRAALDMPAGMFPASSGAALVPIDAPLVFTGFTPEVVQQLAPSLRQAGLVPAQGGASAALLTSAPAAGWEKSLQPGEAVSGVLVSGDMSVTTMGTVTYNNDNRVLAFGHSFLNLGPVVMPMAKSEVLMTLASQLQPNKFGNATEIVGALKQDRHSGVMGVLGEQADMIPSSLKVRTFDEAGRVVKEKDLSFQVFVHQKWTPFLMMSTLYNAVAGLNDFSEEATYRVTGQVEVEGHEKISIDNMFAPSEQQPTPAPLAMAVWWGDKFDRLFLNNVETPRLKAVHATLDVLPERRRTVIQNAWAGASQVEAGGEIEVKIFLLPYRGGIIEQDVKVGIPPGFPKGDHRILVSDAETLNRIQTVARMMNRFLDLPQTVSLINQERTNNKLYVSLVQSRPTIYHDDKTLPSLPGSVANVMQNGRTGNRTFYTAPETALQQYAIPFDSQISGSYSLRIKVN